MGLRAGSMYSEEVIQMFKKAAAFLLSAVIMAGSSTAVFAESVPQTTVVTQEYGASAAKVWDGKSEMKAGQSYVLKKSVTISKKVTIPKGTTLTLNKGVKLGVSASGSLYVKGKLAVKSGASVSVSGTLYTYSGSTLSVSGAVKLNTNKAKVTLGGSLTVNKTGTVSGTPKSIKLGKNGKVTNKGKITCKKLNDLIGGTSTNDQDMKDIENMLNGVFDELISTKSMYSAIKKAVPASYIEQAEKEFEEQIKQYDTNDELAGMTLGDFIDGLFGSLLGDFLDGFEYLQVSIVKATECKDSLTDEQLIYFTGCKEISAAYKVEIKPDYKFKDGYDPAENGVTITSETTEAVVVKADGKWYMCADSLYGL